MRLAALRHVLVTGLTIGVLTAGTGIPAEADDAALLPGLPLLGGASSEPDKRPVTAAEPLLPADRVSPPAPLVRPGFVTVTVSAGADEVPLVVPDAALPLRFEVDRRLAAQHGERAVYDALKQWDGMPGSRWATEYAGLVDATGEAPDGRSVVFAKDDCPAGVGGYAYWQTTTAARDSRYGAGAVYVREVDVAICSGVSDPAALRQVVAHEVGHALGLDHLCDPGQACWKAGMGDGPHACRLMYAGRSACKAAIDAADHDGLVHLYPKLQRVAGPSRVETAARASYATTPAGSATTIVIADAAGPAHGPLAAAALSGVLGGSFLLAYPDDRACLTGAAAEELARVAARPARVILVGRWPQRCAAELDSWGLDVELLGGSEPVALGVAVARAVSSSGRLGEAAVLVSSRADAGGHVPDGVGGGAAAGAARGPILYTGAGALDPAVREWLESEAQRVRRVYVLGGTAAVSERVLADVRALGLEAVRVSGRSRVDTALALASRTELFQARAPVVVAAAESWPDAVTGSALAARSGAPVLLSPAGGHDGVAAWLGTTRPGAGWVVGGAAAIAHEVQWRYSRMLR